jgi:hypothetical protein
MTSKFLTTAKSEFLTLQIYSCLTCRHPYDTAPQQIPSANSTVPTVITTKPKEEEKITRKPCYYLRFLHDLRLQI